MKTSCCGLLERNMPPRAPALALGSCALALLLGATPAAHAAPQAAPDPPASEQAAPQAPACAGLPGGNHALLERMTAAFGLTCDQELRIEPLLHSEESVSKPLLRFEAFSQDEKDGMMLKIKIAARRQILPLLTTNQQAKMNADIDVLSRGGNETEVLGRAKGGSKGNGSGKKKSSEKTEIKIDPFDGEEALSQALANYSALSPDEQKAMILQVKQASRRDGAPALTPDQQKKIDGDIQQLSAK